MQPTAADHPAVREPSQTAMTAAAARAAHLIVDDEPHIFRDNLAARLLGDQAEPLLSYHRSSGDHPILAGARTQTTLRSRWTEAHVSADAAHGVRQYVVLGAGLDTFAYRSPHPDLHVFEVDHPATQAWKLALLDAADIAVPATVTHVAADLEHDDLRDRLRTAGFRTDVPAVVSWLGVVMYLTPAAVSASLRVLATFAPGTRLVADYMLPEHLRDEAGNAYVAGVAPVAAHRGEPWRGFFTPAEMTTALHDAGFTSVHHVGQSEVLEPELWRRTDTLRPARLSQLVTAIVGG